MNYKGVIIEESLDDKSVLEEVSILDTKIEQVTNSHKTPWVTQWTLHTVEIPEDKADEIAKRISESIDTSHENSWYADFNNDNVHYVIFSNKVFKILLGDTAAYENARAYGVKLGIPVYQLAFEKLVKRQN